MWRKVYALVLPVWVLVWVFRWSDLENFLWQVLHWKGFTPKRQKKILFFLCPNIFERVNKIRYFWSFKSQEFFFLLYFVLVPVTAPPIPVPTHYRKLVINEAPTLCNLLCQCLGLKHLNSSTRNKPPLKSPANIFNPDPEVWHSGYPAGANRT